MKVKLLLPLLAAASLFIAGCGSTPQDLIQEKTGLTKEQATAVATRLDELGAKEIEDVSEVNKDKGMYYVQDDKYGRVFFQIINGELARVENQQGVPLTKDNKFTLENTYLSDEDIAKFQVTAQHAVKDKLKSPSTAKFSDEKVQRANNMVMVSGNVDAQNSFGATLRNGYLVQIDYSKNEAVDAALF